ncbi:MAG: hypothetical protein PHQ12_11050 [Chthoniobacteraceae bacterium]|nr:hypothetical protein [Chthoniobacteraceae bacterium]
MNHIMPSLCVLALIAGCTCPSSQAACAKTVVVRVACPVAVAPCDDYVPPLRGVSVSCCHDAYREPYRISYPPICPPSGDLVNVGQTERALAIRRTAILRQRENVRFEKELISAASPIVQPSSTGTVIFGETEGAGVFETGQECPPPAPPYPGPTLGQGGVRGVVRRVPATVGEHVLVGTPVPGRPGFVYSPYARTLGYIDVRGMTPGCLAKDPYTGRTFRVP